MSLIESYIGSFRQGNASPISKASGSWAMAMKLAATIWGMSLLFWTQVRPSNHNMQGRDSEVHQQIQGPFKNLNNMWEQNNLGSILLTSPPRDAESVCTARSRNSWLALMLQSTKSRDVNILQSILKVSNRFGSSQEISIQCYWYIPIYIEIDVELAKLMQA